MYYKNRILPIIRKLIFLTFTILGLYFTYQNLNELDMVVDNSFRLISTYSTPYYEMLTDNTGYTNVNGVSNLINNLKLRGYTLTKDMSTDSYLDMIFSSDTEENQWRIYYKIEDSYIAIFSSNYESSGIGYTYIIEEY